MSASAKPVKTEFYFETVTNISRRLTGKAPRSGRSMVITEKNIEDINAWLGDSSELKTVYTKKNGTTHKLRVKTEKGIRTAVVGDRLVKFGRGAESTYLVEKDS